MAGRDGKKRTELLLSADRDEGGNNQRGHRETQRDRDRERRAI